MRYTLGAAALAAVAFVSSAHAQVVPVAGESFDYAWPGVVGGQSGGFGWAAEWWSGNNGDFAVIQANPPVNAGNMFPFSGADDIGFYAQQVADSQASFRPIDVTPHADITDPAAINAQNGLPMIGVDGATVWLSYTCQNFLSYGNGTDVTARFMGVSFNELFGPEKFFTGAPWMANSWGIDDQQPNGKGISLIPGTNDEVTSTIVVRMDYLPGDERCRVWIDPNVAWPTTAADLDVMVQDHRWNEIKMNSGGCLGYWDNIVIAKGVPLEETFCTSAPNSTGAVAGLQVLGSNDLPLMDFSLKATNIPVGQSGYFLASMAQDVIVAPMPHSGTLCLGSHRARLLYTLDAADASGCIVAAIDLTSVPVNPVALPVMGGDTWYWQMWYRDGMASNFTDAVGVTFIEN